MSNEQAIVDFQSAREHYLAGRFAEARATMQRYRQAIDYRQFKQSDHRNKQKPEISVIIVSYATGKELIDCLNSVLAQKGPAFEVILVDNGNNESVHAQLAKLPVLLITPPINLLPSEGRNVGAHFARGEILIFLDDDALMAPGYIAEASKALQDSNCIALRGKVLPKNPNSARPPPKHYNLGNLPIPAELRLEGNMAIRRMNFAKVGGFDPLQFGHEGKELTARLMQRFPQYKILYIPTLIISHDFAESQNLHAKRQRQDLAKNYLQYLKEQQTMSMSRGISILVRAGDNLAAADEFLASLLKHNTNKHIEVLLWAKDSQQALAVSGAYISKLFIRVLPASAGRLSRIGAQARYENILIVDVPALIKVGALENWFQNKRADLDTALFCDKQIISKLSEAAINMPLAQLTEILAQSISEQAAHPGTHTLLKQTSKSQTPLPTQECQGWLVPIARETIPKLKVLVVSPRQLGILGTPGTYLFVEALANWVELVVLCNSEGRPSEKTPRVYTPSATLRIVEASFSKGIDQELRNLTETFSPDIVHLMVWQKWPEIAKTIRQYVPYAKFVLDIKTPLLAEGEIRLRVQATGSANRDLIDLIMTRQSGEEETWIPENDRPVTEYPLGVSMEQIDGTDVLSSRQLLKCVYIGSTHPKRQLERLLWLVSNIEPALRRVVVLDIYGSGGSQQDLLQLADKLRLGGQVRILNALPQAELFSRLKEYDIGIAWVPWGEYDSAPSLKFLEYAASRLSIIATDTFAHKRNVEEGFEAHLFNNSPSGLGRALVAASEEIRSECSKNSNYSLARTRDWKIISIQYFVYAYSRLLLDDTSAHSLNQSLSLVFSQLTALPEYATRHPYILEKLGTIRGHRNAYEFF
jgi:GT2 family glycosyltransferase